MRIETETTSLLTTPSGNDDYDSPKEKPSNNSILGFYYYHYPRNVERNVVAAKVISYSAVGLTLLLAVIATVMAVTNGTKFMKGLVLPTNSIGPNEKQGYDLWFGHHQSSSSSWWDSSRDFFKSKKWLSHDEETKDDWDHTWINDSNWNKNWNTTGHTYEHSSSYEYHHDKNGDKTQESHERETWTERFDNGTVTHYERWIDNDGTPHIKSWTTSG